VTHYKEKTTIENEFDYYLIEFDGSYYSPLLMNDDANDPYGGMVYLSRSIKVEDDRVAYLTFNPPIPKKPQMVDYLHIQCRAAFSKKVYDVLKDKDIKGLQLIPAVIRGKKDEQYTDYWVANVYNEYAFLDIVESDWEGSINENGRWGMINAMVFDKELIAKVPLEERLLFVTHESSGYVLYHKTIVDLIMSVNPVGLKFTHIDDWYNGIKWDE
jgi:hypothetical protein